MVSIVGRRRWFWKCCERTKREKFHRWELRVIEFFGTKVWGREKEVGLNMHSVTVRKVW